MSLFDLSASTNSRKVPILNADYPQDVTMKATDGNATFAAVIAKDGRPDKYTYQWYVNGAAVAGATGATYVRNVSGDKGGVHTVWCEVSNKAGTVRTREAKLTVKKVPVLNGNYPANANVVVANSATFSVSVAEDGYPTNYSYQWYVNGAAVSGATGSRYTIAAPAGYTYIYCVVTNEVGSVQSRTATLGVSASYFFSNGAFHYGGSYDWIGNSDTLQECGLENGLWYLRIDGSGHFGATWGTAYADLTGIRHVIFTLRTYTSGSNDSSIGIGRVGVVQSDNLGTTGVVAGTSFKLYTNDNYTDYAFDVSHLSGNYIMKFVVDRTNTKYDEDRIYVSAIRFE